MMSVDQMGILFQLLIAQNKDRKIVDIFKDYCDPNTTFGSCNIEKEDYGKKGNYSYISCVGLESIDRTVVRYRISYNCESVSWFDFVTWINGDSFENEYESFLKHILKFVSFEDKV